MAILQLLNVNYLNSDYNHTIDFADVDAQEDYFDALVNTTIDLPTNDDYVYIRENKRIRVGIGKADLDGVNYLRFNNGNKWWYAFINNKEYVNENCTDLIIEIDVFQTFMFDYTIKESFISRSHQNRYAEYSDGKVYEEYPYNIEDENINVGNEYELVASSVLQEKDGVDDTIWFEIVTGESMSTWTTPDHYENKSYTLVTDNYDTGLYCYLVPVKKSSTGYYMTDVHGTTQAIQKDILERIIGSDALISLRILPYSPIKYTASQVAGGYKLSFTEGYDSALPTGTEPYTYSVHLVECNNSNWGGINLTTGTTRWCINVHYYKDSIRNVLEYNDITPTPAYNTNTFAPGQTKRLDPKTKIYPYRYAEITDYQGEGLVIKRQNLCTPAGIIDGDKNEIEFRQSLSVMPKIKYYVTNYLGDSQGKKENYINNNICEMPLINDAYLSYISQNKASATYGMAINTYLDVGTNIARTAVGIGTGNPFAISNAISGASSTIKNITNEIIKFEDLKGVPQNLKKLGNNGEFDYLDNNLKIRVAYYSIKTPYRNRLNDYFYRYGYSYKKFTTPNLKSRYYFNYIQAPDMCIDTGIDNEYISKLKSIFANGITIWHYRDSATWGGVENYQYDNVEMSLLN